MLNVSLDLGVVAAMLLSIVLPDAHFVIDSLNSPTVKPILDDNY